MSVARNRAADTVFTAVGGVAVLFGAALVGILIARRFGASASTDGFFVAHALYAVFLILAQSLRMTTVPRLIDGDIGARFNTELRGIALVFAGSGALFVAAGLGLAPLVASGDALRTFQVALLVLWPAVGLQLFAGLGAAMLATWGDYRVAALAFAAGAVANVAGFLALTPPLGVNGIPAALVVGATVSAGLIALALRRKGRRTRGDGAWWAGRGSCVGGADPARRGRVRRHSDRTADLGCVCRHRRCRPCVSLLVCGDASGSVERGVGFADQHRLRAGGRP